MKKIDITGGRFGRLVAISEAGLDSHNNAMWQCQCDCGAMVKAAGSDLRKGHTKSCGCLSADKLKERSTTHGGANSRIYKAWQNMKNRCLNPAATRYEEYGGRGITICEEWGSFETFREWAMASGYDDTLTIERKDVNGNYSPGNCEWIPLADQNLNTRSLKYVEIDGETKLQKEWLQHFGISKCKYYEAIRAGASRKEAIMLLKDRIKRKSKSQP